MELKTVVYNALVYQSKCVQIDCKYDGEERLKHNNKHLSYIAEGGQVDKEWLLVDANYFLSVFDQYNKYLKEQLNETDLLFDDIEGVKQERRVLNRWIPKLAESSQ